ncbi:MAG: DUF1700 domain-containing protein [Lachnospiraceae bacterium]|jgi:uncharacterized membrane protein|nr:DUF1700 domain-containing protein [Lachnospiraceae bacterium]MCI9203343.1 DUF1700 domain-containing protein [Lachnospiraceae bacterium]
MDSLRNDYLNKIDKYLRPLPASERADIINEIKSQMMELEAEKRLSSDQIIQRLGNPKELAGALLICGVIAPVSGLIQAVGFLLGFDVPWVSFQFGSWTAHPLLALPLSILFGILFMLAGKGLWKITLKYIQVVSRQKNSVITGYN